VRPTALAPRVALGVEVLDAHAQTERRSERCDLQLIGERLVPLDLLRAKVLDAQSFEVRTPFIAHVRTLNVRGGNEAQPVECVRRLRVLACLVDERGLAARHIRVAEPARDLDEAPAILDNLLPPGADQGARSGGRELFDAAFPRRLVQIVEQRVRRLGNTQEVDSTLEPSHPKRAEEAVSLAADLTYVRVAS